MTTLSILTPLPAPARQRCSSSGVAVDIQATRAVVPHLLKVGSRGGQSVEFAHQPRDTSARSHPRKTATSTGVDVPLRSPASGAARTRHGPLPPTVNDPALRCRKKPGCAMPVGTRNCPQLATVYPSSSRPVVVASTKPIPLPHRAAHRHYGFIKHPLQATVPATLSPLLQSR